jgi:hypothetical protein
MDDIWDNSGQPVCFGPWGAVLIVLDFLKSRESE